MIARNKISSYLLVCSTVFLLFGCSKEAKILNELEGNWNVSSFQVDNSETIGIDIQSITIEFETYDKQADQGVMQWLIFDLDGEILNYNLWDYTILAEGSQLLMHLDRLSLTHTADLSINNTTLELYWEDNGIPYFVIAIKE